MKLGVLQFGDYSSLTDLYEGVVETVGDVDIVLKNANGVPADLMLHAQSLKAEGVDAVLAITTQATQTAMVVFDDTPLFFGAVSDVTSLDLPSNKNIGGVSDRAPYDKQLQLIEALTPKVKRVGVVYRLGDANGVHQVDQIIEDAKGTSLDVVTKGVNDATELGLISKSFIESVDALFLITDDLNVSNTQVLAHQATQQHKPVYATESGQFEDGVFASVGINYRLLGNQLGNMIAAKDYTVQMPADVMTQINKQQSDVLGISIPESYIDFFVE